MYRNSKMSALGQTCPQGTVGVPPYCYPTGGQPADPSGVCPPGQCGWPPYCYPCEPGAPVPEPAAAGGACPPGTYGYPPYCFGTPTQPEPTPQPVPGPDPGAGTCPPGTYGYPPYCYSVPGQMPPGVPGLPGTTPPAPGLPAPTVPPAVPGMPSVPGAPGPAPQPAPPTPVQPQGGSWWDQRSQTEKALIIGGGALAGVAILAGVFGKKKKRTAAVAATPNRRRRRRSTKRKGRRVRRNARKTRCNRVARRKAAPRLPAFKPVAWTKRERSKLRCATDKRIGNCHCKAPLKYAREGASKPTDYAYPKCFMYPLWFTNATKSRKHIRNAAARFAQNMDRYPPDVQRVMYKRIMAAKKAYGIGEFRGLKPPKARKRAAPRRRTYRRAA